ncbi:hypothetical protein H2199_000862 [Coniosporium tulheliwenetii]|uniref:Uncharacterized protein n=1 Tax=Coniosporium tulheliwenetii TaxID=3383036 RepID=A0ACC2ZN00_9PEZI|nr:hypothetical protein H2199_000862 [Cladosporium sp. JES 115]
MSSQSHSALVPPLPATVRIAQVVGVTTASFLAGTIATYSYAFVPAVSLAPAPLLAQQWQKAYGIGASTAPPMALVAAVSFSYLASEAMKTPAAFSGSASLDPTSVAYLYTAAAVLVPAIVPYTLLGMKAVNGALHAKADKLRTSSFDKPSTASEDREVKELVGRWKVLNAVRALLAGVGAVAGVVAVVW